LFRTSVANTTQHKKQTIVSRKFGNPQAKVPHVRKLNFFKKKPEKSTRTQRQNKHRERSGQANVVGTGMLLRAFFFFLFFFVLLRFGATIMIMIITHLLQQPTCIHEEHDDEHQHHDGSVVA
jgi:phage FluMu protein Com